MSTLVHNKIRDLIKREATGTISSINCTLKYNDFVPKSSLQKDEVVKKMSVELIKLLKSGPHPTMNPLMDALAVEKQGDFDETVFHYIMKYSKTETNECDYLNDIMTVRVNVPLIMINVLPFIEQDVIEIEEAVVQTPLFRYVLDSTKEPTK